MNCCFDFVYNHAFNVYKTRTNENKTNLGKNPHRLILAVCVNLKDAYNLEINKAVCQATWLSSCKRPRYSPQFYHRLRHSFSLHNLFSPTIGNFIQNILIFPWTWDGLTWAWCIKMHLIGIFVFPSKMFAFPPFWKVRPLERVMT